ncbi:hypothetical protein NEOLEDRAFT_1242640 [Neolentinus lepideus HHB14362 ss-1]|uniref:Uncharacterized protein n=1 Tax=Neolentinus lepideus HHB14362 ss-1 TaxID=1314782 RepID=A0A165RQW8_9AGAM|nr:hypothetical protein NEOLEDRAFT_1242640 [Neolentinus lepideus HHB14362 ss-1]
MSTVMGPISLPGTLSVISSSTNTLSVTPSLISLPNPSASSSISSPAATPTAVLAFHAIENMTACDSGTVTWTFSGSSGGNLSLVVTNSNVPQSPPTLSRTITPEPLTARSHVRRDVQAMDRLLVTGIDPSALSWTWSPVNVTQGWYDMEAFTLYLGQGSSQVYTAASTQFYVANGSDTSCLNAVVPPSSSSVPSSSPTSIPVSTLSSGSHTNVGAVVGGVLGGLVGLCAILAAIFYFRGRTRTRGRARSVSGSGPAGGWGGLKSAGLQHRSRDRNAPTESVGTVVGQTAYTPHGSDSEVNSLEGEKILAARPYENVASLGYDVKRSSTASSIASTAVSSSSRPQSSSAHGPPIAKRDSQSSTRNRPRRSFEAGSPRRVAVPPISYMPPSHVPDSHPYPPSPQSPEPVPLSRSASGGRRAARKPVPKYDASEFTDIETGSEMTAPSTVQHETIGLPELNHKSSLGEKKMHYILPDMPPPPVN